ncbi:hypothetical protein CJ030_MR3G022816 [Morella rubra]|uniref:Uncharacterized protein n=1 Tax=Morella rubra TaxID=262757 RepID=A0A6A1WAW7_9ROSI|nr:hypothetical protein CJ030_MR3G022816 [Morella rubra]
MSQQERLFPEHSRKEKMGRRENREKVGGRGGVSKALLLNCIHSKATMCSMNHPNRFSLFISPSNNGSPDPKECKF